MLWFTGDTHFGHANIIRHANRPFNTLKEMDLALLDGINKYVKSTDVLYHLGDFAWKPSQYGWYRSRINCKRIFVIKGNHDRAKLREFVTDLFPEWMLALSEKQFIHLYHYPLISWYKSCHGSIHLHGHCHGMLSHVFPYTRRLDVGVDNIYLNSWWRVSSDFTR